MALHSFQQLRHGQHTFEEIQVHFSPYTYVRVLAMLSKLYKKADYDKFAKMSFPEIATALQDSHYAPEITEVTQQFTDITFDILELALQKNLSRTFLHLKKISSGELQLLVDAYLHRYDYTNLKTLFRGIFSGAPSHEIERLFIPVGSLSSSELKHLLELGSVEKVVEELPFLSSQRSQVASALTYFRTHHSLFLLENLFDHAYFEFIITFAQRIPVQGQLFRDFLEYEIDVLNLKLLLRLKRIQLPEAQVDEHLFFSGKLLPASRLKALIQKDLTGILESLERTAFGKMIQEHKAALEQGDSAAFELALDAFLLKTSTRLLHQHLLSVDTVLSFLFAKEIEVRNLRMLIKGKQLGLSESFFSRQLVVVS